MNHCHGQIVDMTLTGLGADHTCDFGMKGNESWSCIRLSVALLREEAQCEREVYARWTDWCRTWWRRLKTDSVPNTHI